jgi:multidrug resistance efflux pump
MANLDIEQTRNQARALLDSRIESVTQLVKARQRVADLKEQLTEAERDDKRSYVRATKDGWSTEELKKLGLEPGAVTRRRKTSASQTPGQASAPRHGGILDTAPTQS